MQNPVIEIFSFSGESSTDGDVLLRTHHARADAELPLHISNPWVLTDPVSLNAYIQ